MIHNQDTFLDDKEIYNDDFWINNPLLKIFY
jgi:hypothetical protein